MRSFLNAIVFLMPSNDYLMLRSPPRARLEARTALLQRSLRRSTNWLTASQAGIQGRRASAVVLDPRFRGGDDILMIKPGLFQV